jgi:hypothetical protein
VSADASGQEPPLVCWQYVPGVCRFQTSSPIIARKLGQRNGARLVAWSVNGEYLRIFEERIDPWRARQLVKCYLKATNGAILARKSPPSRSTAAGVSAPRSSGMRASGGVSSNAPGSIKLTALRKESR